MNKVFEFTLAVKSPYNPIKIIFHDVVESDNIVELCSKMPLSIARAIDTLRQHKEQHQQVIDDDIPF